MKDIKEATLQRDEDDAVPGDDEGLWLDLNIALPEKVATIVVILRIEREE